MRANITTLVCFTVFGHSWLKQKSQIRLMLTVKWNLHRTWMYLSRNALIPLV